MIDKLGSAKDPNLESILEQVHKNALGSLFATTLPTEAPDGKIVITETSTGPMYASAKTGLGTTFIIGSILENRTSDPASPVTGQMWFRTDL